MQIVTFVSQRATCEGDFLTATNDRLRSEEGRPCVVMAHGFGTTRDSGLHRFAERFAEAGCDVLVFDYRGFGGSGGHPQQDVNHRRHREDYHAAIDWARRQRGIDPDRVAIWGSSYSGGHVLAVAAQDPRVAGVISQGAAVDGLAALTGRGKVRDPERPKASGASAGKGQGKGRRIGLAVAEDLLRWALRRDPRIISFLGDAESGAMISGEGAEAFAAITGPTFRNEMCARGIARIPFNRPIRSASQVRCPTLFILATYDEIAPSGAVRSAAEKMGSNAQVVEYPVGHFAVYDEVFEDSISHQTSFLTRVFG